MKTRRSLDKRNVTKVIHRTGSLRWRAHAAFRKEQEQLKQLTAWAKRS